MTRRIWLSALVLLVAFCIGLSLLTTAGAVLIIRENGAVPVELTPAP